MLEACSRGLVAFPKPLVNARPTPPSKRRSPKRLDEANTNKGSRGDAEYCREVVEGVDIIFNDGLWWRVSLQLGTMSM